MHIRMVQIWACFSITAYRKKTELIWELEYFFQLGLTAQRASHIRQLFLRHWKGIKTQLPIKPHIKRKRGRQILETSCNMDISIHTNGFFAILPKESSQKKIQIQVLTLASPDGPAKRYNIRSCPSPLCRNYFPDKYRQFYPY